MVDKQRSYIMSKVKSRNTKPEIIVRKFLFSKGFRYRINVKTLYGTPDIVLKKYKTVIFINGCFWHGHEVCNKYKSPKTNPKFWDDKINRNRERDIKTKQLFVGAGWNVITIWECMLNKKNGENTLNELSLTLSKIILNKYKIP
ncbi:MAG: very short patch repair endonuclease [Prevotella sp.]|jgi:DNA mismatch endonuclease (patch repair protein)|nr:very short patch repair endonuclease [Prevotella sp.]